MRKKVFCDVCSFDLTDDSGYATIGKVVQLSSSAPEKQRAINMFGKDKFNICYCCYLKSLGIKQPKTETVSDSKRPPAAETTDTSKESEDSKKSKSSKESKE
jgi:hypothetical protein